MANYSGLSLFIKRLFMYIIYTLMGMIIFFLIEKDNSVRVHKERQIRRSNLSNKLRQQFNLSTEEVQTLFSEFKTALHGDSELEWTMMNSHYFVMQLLTTIGYGNITPKTTIGRILCIPYALIGIPLTVLFLQTFGRIFSSLQKRLIVAFECKVLKRCPPIKNLSRKSLILTSISTAIILVQGALLFSIHDNKGTIIDGFYAWTITLTTVGFGDELAASPRPERIVDPMDLYELVLTFVGLCVVTIGINNASDCINEAQIKMDNFESAICCFCCKTTRVKTNSVHDDQETRDEEL